MKDKADGRKLDAVSIKCVNGTTSQLGFNPCLAQTLLASKDLSVICECDAYGLVTSIILSTVTGNASAFMEHYEIFDDEVLVGVCGFIPPEFADGAVKVRAANLGETNTGISNVSKVRTGEVTYGRFYNENGKFKLFLSHGEAKPCPKWTELGWEEPTPDFPAVLLKLEVPMQKYIENVPGQHIIMVYGDYIEKVKTVCNLLDIEVVM
jgi:L-fucose isomerase-like protein